MAGLHIQLVGGQQAGRGVDVEVGAEIGRQAVLGHPAHQVLRPGVEEAVEGLGQRPVQRDLRSAHTAAGIEVVNAFATVGVVGLNGEHGHANQRFHAGRGHRRPHHERHGAGVGAAADVGVVQPAGPIRRHAQAVVARPAAAIGGSVSRHAGVADGHQGADHVDIWLTDTGEGDPVVGGAGAHGLRVTQEEVQRATHHHGRPVGVALEAGADGVDGARQHQRGAADRGRGVHEIATGQYGGLAGCVGLHGALCVSKG